jgi:hypothetical protein
MRRQLVASGAAVTTALAVGLAMSALPAVATHVEPETIRGNPTCSGLISDGIIELKVEPVADGTFSDGTLTVTIDVRDTADGPVFDWTSNIGVDAVFVKGGPNGNLYVYDPEATADTGLHAPVNPNNDKFYGLSHISFCYDKDETTTPPTKPPTTPPTKPPTESPTKPPTTETPTVAPTTPAPVPTEVPAGATGGGSGSAGLVGLGLAGAAAAAGAAVVARRRFLHDS